VKILNKIKKGLEYYFNLNYPITIEKYTEYDGREYFAAEIPDLPGCGAEGKTVDEALKKLEEAKKAWIEVSLERGLEIPEPATEDQFSGKFLLRIPAKLHRQLALKAKRTNTSLNQYVRSILEKSLYEDQIISKLEELEDQIRHLEIEVRENKAYLSRTLEEYFSRYLSIARMVPHISTEEIGRWKFFTKVESTGKEEHIERTLI